MSSFRLRIERLPAPLKRLSAAMVENRNPGRRRRRRRRPSANSGCLLTVSWLQHPKRPPKHPPDLGETRSPNPIITLAACVCAHSERPPLAARGFQVSTFMTPMAYAFRKKPEQESSSTTSTKTSRPPKRGARTETPTAPLHSRVVNNSPSGCSLRRCQHLPQQPHNLMDGSEAAMQEDYRGKVERSEKKRDDHDADRGPGCPRRCKQERTLPNDQSSCGAGH